MPPWLLFIIFFVFALALFIFVILPAFISTACANHVIGYKYLCDLLGYDW